jgi:hypothetical protein
LTITVIAENGGFRKLVGPGTTSQIDTFIGQTSRKSTMFRFDFTKPHHCQEDSDIHCTAKALEAIEDITKVSFSFQKIKFGVV